MTDILFTVHDDCDLEDTAFDRRKPMKREHVDDHGILAIRSLFFWRRCEICKKEFRREYGWAKLCGPWINGGGRWKYACCECAPTRKDFAEFLDRLALRRPPPPKGSRPLIEGSR